MLFLIGCASLHSFTISSANSYVRISTDCPDVFTAKGVVYWARQANFYGLLEASNVIVQGNDVYVIGDACDAILSIASEIKRQAIDEEFSKSWKYVRARRNWTEYQAKKKVNYSAAWRYHCTYGNGSESEPTYEKHPAYR